MPTGPRTLGAAFFSSLGVALCLVPATRVMGYEFAFAAGLAGVLFGAPLLVQLGVVEAIAVAALTPACGLVGSLFVKNCNLARGLEWFVVLSAVQWFVAAAVFAWLARRYGFRGALGRYAIVVLACVAYVLHGLYAGPSIRFYHPLFGFFAGSLYDEALPIPTALYWHQLMCIFGGLALALGGAQASRWRRDLRWLSAAAAIMLWSRGEAHGFRQSRAGLLRALSAHVVTPHLVVHFAPGGAVDRDKARWWPEAEFAAERVAAALALEPARPTHVYIYDSAPQKAALMGASHTLFTRPWVPEVHLLYDGGRLQALEHELVHAFAAEWNTSIVRVPVRFGVVPNIALVEGLAVAVAPHENFSPHVAMAALRHFDRAPRLDALFSWGFYADTGERAYTAAGSFVRFLLETRGRERVRAAYAGGDVAAAMGAPLSTLIAEYEAFIDRVPIDERLARSLAMQFREKPLYLRVCGREFAERRERAAALRAQGRTNEAADIYREMAADDPRDVSVKVLLADALRFTDGEGFLREAAELARRADVSPRQAIRLREAMAEQLAALGRRDEARAWLEEAAGLASEGDDQRRVSVALALVASPVTAPALASLDADTPMERALVTLEEVFHAAPASGLVNYLLARRLAIAGDLPRAVVHLQAALAAAEGGPTALPTAALPFAALPFATLPEAAKFEARRILIEWRIALRDLTGINDALGELIEVARGEREIAMAAELSAKVHFYSAHPTW